MSDRVLVGVAAAPLAAELLRPWAASFRKLCPATPAVLICDPVEDYQALADEYGIEAWKADLLQTSSDPHNVFKTRWGALATVLEHCDPDGTVLMTDTRDVFFQADPFAALDGCITVATESVWFAEQPWNRQQLEMFFPKDVAVVMYQPVICAGVVAGPRNLLRNLAQQVARQIGDRPGLADQAALNIVLRTSWAFQMELDPPAWTVHCAQRLPQSRIYGPGKRLLPHATLAMTDSGPEVCNEMGRPFAIVHHWPHVPQLKSFGGVR